MGYIKAKPTERITLVSDPKYWVEVSTDLTWADMKQVANVADSGQVSYQVDALLNVAIRAWNLDAEDGTLLPLTQENIDLLKRPDIEKIISVLGGKIEEHREAKKG